MRFEYNGEVFKFWFHRFYRPIPGRPDLPMEARCTHPYTTVYVQKLVKMPMGDKQVDAWQPYLTYTIGTHHSVKHPRKTDTNYAALRALTKDTCSKEFKAAIFGAYSKRNHVVVAEVVSEVD